MSLYKYCFTVHIFVIHLNFGISLWNIPVMNTHEYEPRHAKRVFPTDAKTKAKTSLHIWAV